MPNYSLSELDEGMDSVNPPTVVLYHGGGCADEFAAAWSCYRALGEDEAVYLPVNYGKGPPYVPYGARVFILDFSYPAADLLSLADQCAAITVLDHHLSAERELSGLTHPKLSITFDMTKSGAMLAWEHFHPGVEPPDLIRFVQDMDLWQFLLPDSRAINAVIRSYPHDFSTWDELAEVIANGSPCL